MLWVCPPWGYAQEHGRFIPLADTRACFWLWGLAWTRKERLFPDYSVIVAAQSSQQDYRRKDWTSAATRVSLLMTLGF